MTEGTNPGASCSFLGPISDAALRRYPLTARQSFLSPSFATLPAFTHKRHFGLGLAQAPEDIAIGGPPPGLCWLNSEDSELGEGTGLGQQGSGRGPSCKVGAHQDSNGFRQGPAGLEAFLGILHHVFPLQAHCSKGPAHCFLALGVEDEAACDLVLHRWPWGEGHTDFYSPSQEH